MNDKQSLRKYYKQVRKSIADRAQKDCAILGKVIELVLTGSYKDIFIYVSMDSEADTKEIIQRLKGKTDIYVPHTEGESLAPVLYLGESLMPDKMGNIYSKGVVCADIVPALTIMPLLAFDTQLNRLGYGRGCYDRYLSGRTTFKAAIAYDEQLASGLPSDKHDITADIIITPNYIYRR